MIQLHVDFEMIYQGAQPTPMMLALSIHASRAADLVRPDQLVTDPPVPRTSYLDLFGNRCSRLVAPQGPFVLRSDTVLNDPGLPDTVAPWAVQNAVEDLPESTLIYLLGSRYCETELLSDIAWQHFASVPAGWTRVQAICDFVHRHIEFGYPLLNAPYREGRRPLRPWQPVAHGGRERSLGDACRAPVFARTRSRHVGQISVCSEISSASSTSIPR